ncbi:MAG: autotransporter outer membrane beta-barrel domain-containing protein, partial [Veillonellaceae bacterium]|nr:autotransporter outer membrane beta-barrel domain-containing protein [Veillonellaceae bacterium]
YVPDAPAATSVRSKRSMPRRTLAATASSTSGNTLNVTKATTVGNLAKFDTYNFYLPAGTSNGATMLHLMDNADTDMTNSTVNVKASGALNLYNNENVYLIKKEGGSLLTDGMTTNVGEANVLIGVTAELTCAVENKDNNLVLNVTKGPEKPSSSSSSGGSSSSSSSSGSGSSGSSSESSNTSSTENANSASSSGNASSSSSSTTSSTPRVTINPDTKSAVETRAAQSNVVNMGSDYFVDTTLPQIAGLAYGADGFGAFGGSSGSAHMRYKTGSHVDARGTAFNAGIAKKNANKSGAFTWGPFFETGHGNYDSYLDNGTHGSGSTNYTGGGIFARQEFASGCYVEGSLRTGKTKADYSSSDLGTSYSTDAPYFGAHLGVGRVLPMHGGSLDIYGRYLYSRTGSDSAHLATGETYDFDAVDSHRLMLGARYTREANQFSKWYAGAALLYEFGGEARAHFQGYSLASPSSAGASVMLEGGWKYAPTATSPFELDLGATGYLGKQQGLMFHANVNYAF